MGRPLIDLTGQRFGILTVIEPIYIETSKRWKWRCKCDCGNETLSYANNLKHMHSCGCLHRKWSHERLYKHGKSHSRLFPIWQSMRQRCNNPKNHAYDRYGGRGIKVCKAWDEDFEAFEKWALANGYDENAVGKSCTLDRINNDGDYEPRNCRWADGKVQNNNKNNCVFIEYSGQRKTIAEWSEITGLSHSTILGRIRRGWGVEEALTTSPKRHKRTRIAEVKNRGNDDL